MVEGPMLLVLLTISILLLILFIARLKIHAFLSLLIIAFGLGLCAGMAPADVINTITTGFGNSMRAIGIVILLGTIIGVVLDKSAAAITMANLILRVVGPKRPALAMNIIGYIVSIPVFCDSGFVILSSLNKSLARRSGTSMATMAVALSTGLYATHVMVPPTPGPIAAAGNLHADLGMVILMGLLVSIPVSIVGYLYASWVGKGMPAGEFDASDLPQEEFGAGMKLPTGFQAFAPIVLPILLIGLRSIFLFPTVLEAVGKDSLLVKLFSFIGDPVVALFLGLLLCIPLVPKLNEEVMTGWVGQGIKDAGAIIVITAAGGSLGAIIAATKIGGYLGTTLAEYNLGILLPFIIAAALKTAQGSSTVALITASTIVYPLLGNLGLATPMGAVLSTLAVGCGAMVVSHSNDSYFWVVSQFSGLKVDVAYKTHTVATLVQGATGIAILWILVQVLV